MKLKIKRMCKIQFENESDLVAWIHINLLRHRVNYEYWTKYNFLTLLCCFIDYRYQIIQYKKNCTFTVL